MRRILSLLVLAVLVPVSQAQDKPKPVRVCVATLANKSQHIVSPAWQQEQLIKALERTNKNKDVKKGKAPKIETVALESSGEPDSTVREKDCELVLYTDLVEVFQPGHPSVSVPPPGAIQVGTAMGDPRAYPPDYQRATVNYRLMRSGHIKPSSEGILTAQDALPEETLVSQLMDQVANRVVSEIRKPHDSTPEF